MAKSGEHRMLFDLRGRRKRVIQVAFGGLALLMGLSLFTVVGPVNLGDLVGNGSSSGSTSGVFDAQVQRIERQLHKSPNDPALLAQLTRATFNAGNAGIPRDASGNVTGSPSQSVINDFNKAGDAWQRYLKTNPSKPDASTALLAAQAVLNTATLANLSEKAPIAAEAQAIYAKARPSPNGYLTLAQYRFLAGDAAGGEQAGRKAKQLVPKSQQSTVKQALVQYRQQATAIQKQAKAARKAVAAGGKQALENPLGGLSGGGSGAGTSVP